MPHPPLIFSQSDYLIRLLIQGHIINDIADPDQVACFFRDQLIWTYTVCKGTAYPGLAGQGLRYKISIDRIEQWRSDLINENTKT